MTDLATDEDRWLDWRKGGITATDVADAAQGTYGGAYGVVARKLGLITVEQNNAMRRGHIWQPRIADAVHDVDDVDEHLLTVNWSEPEAWWGVDAG